MYHIERKTVDGWKWTDTFRNPGKLILFLEKTPARLRADMRVRTGPPNPALEAAESFLERFRKFYYENA